MGLIFEDYANGLEADQLLVIMPISRLIIEDHFRIGQFNFFPSGSFSTTQFDLCRPLESSSLFESERAFSLSGEDLRVVSTQLTGATANILETHTFVCFTNDLIVPSRAHKEDIGMLAMFSQKVERAMDWIRFNFCRFDLPATLPGFAGTWQGSDTFCMAILVELSGRKAEIIAGEVLLHSNVSRGLGLELSFSQCSDTDSIPCPLDGEVGGIVSHALSLYSDVMNANTYTSKYLRAMTLLEFLASPFRYQNFKDGKREIITHLANNQETYHKKMARFRQLSDLKCEDSNVQLGYRTLLVHHGRYLEDVLQHADERNELFLELQSYAGKVIGDLCDRRSLEWSEIVEWRKNRRSQILGAKP